MIKNTHTGIRLLGGLAVLLVFGCKSQFDLYAPGENFQALDKITDGEDICEAPFAGMQGRPLFFTVLDKHGVSRNIYKKDNPISASMNQKTAGKNDYRHPSYSPAINKLIFSGRQEGSTTSDIYMVDATQGSALTQVTNTPDATEYFPCISTDGRFVVYQKFTLYSNNLKDCEIWIKNLQNGENSMLTHGRMPSFSPDGRSIAFVRYTMDGQNTCLWTMNTDGSNPTQLTDSKLGVVNCPRFSPDGRQIVFQCSKKQKKDDDLYIIDLNGNNLTQLTVNKSYDGDPFWANDGNIYFSSDRGGLKGHYQIWRFHYGGSVPAQSFNTVGSTPVTTETTPSVTTVTETQGKIPTPNYSSVYHTVKDGETITQIARQYGVTVKNIVQWNNLTTMTIKTGMRLKVSQ